MKHDRALFISPHLDDVAFSCGGTLARVLREGWSVHLVTIFAGSSHPAEGFALECQTSKGVHCETDYMGLRRAEDCAYAKAVGVTRLEHWDFLEAPHRGYSSAKALFAGERAGDDVWTRVAPLLRGLADKLQPGAVFAPQGLGNHVDHLQTIRAVLAAGLAPVTAWYRDTPYAIREPSTRPAGLLPPGLRPCTVDIASTLKMKILGCSAYESQLAFQFGGKDALRTILTNFHRAESGEHGFCETFLGTPALATLHLFNSV